MLNAHRESILLQHSYTGVYEFPMVRFGPPAFSTNAGRRPSVKPTELLREPVSLTFHFPVLRGEGEGRGFPRCWLVEKLAISSSTASNPRFANGPIRLLA